MDIGLWRSAQIECPHCKEAITVFPISTPNGTNVVCTFCSHSLLVDLEKAIKITYKYDVTVGQKESDITPSLRILLIEDNIDMQRLLKEEELFDAIKRIFKKANMWGYKYERQRR